MSRKLNSISALFALAVLVLCLMNASNVAAQTQECADLSAATGQQGWMLVSGPGISTPKVPVTVGSYPGWQSPPLLGSSWVSIDANQGSQAGATGDYTYETSFCLCRDGKHALSLSFYADNGAKVFLNNTTLLFATSGSYNFSGAPKVVNYSWVGGPGINKVQIVVHNDSGPTGLNAVLKITGANTGNCCPDLNTSTGQQGWVLTSSPGVTIPKTPVVVSPYAGWQNPTLAGSSWISIDANRGGLAGNYTYDFPFCLCGNGKHQVNLSFYADNGATVLLNGTQIFATSGINNFNGAPNVVNYGWSGGPTQGTLRIIVSNQSSVTGLDAVLKITGASAGRCPRTVGTATMADESIKNTGLQPSVGP